MRIAAFLIPLILCGASEGTKSPIVTTDLLKIRRVTEVEVARDGSFAVYGVQQIHSEPPARPAPDAEPAYSYRTHLFFIDLNDATAKPVQLTHGDRTDSGIALSPDGTRLAFTRIDAAPAGAAARGPRTQVWIMPVRGVGEAQAITKLENGAAAPRWRPDGKALLVTSLIPISKIEGTPHYDLERPKRAWFDWDRAKPGDKADEKPAKIEASPDGDRRAIRNWLARNGAKENPSEITRLNFLGELGLAPESTIAHLFLIDLEHANKSTQLTKDFYSHGAASFSPDGSQIVFTSSPQGPANPDRLRRAAIWIMNADGSNARPVLDKDGWAYSLARFTRDGKSLVVVTQQADQPGFRQARLARYDLETKKQTWLAENCESTVNNFQLASDGSVLFASNWHGGEPLERAPLAGGNAAALTKASAGVSAFGEGGGRVVFSQISVENPNELHVIDKGGALRRLTDLNTSWLAQKSLSMPTEHWITRPDGVKVQYWVMLPTNAESGKKYPWVLEIHGGPTAMWGPGEFTMWHEFQMLCSWGYGVVYSNPRGSGGYGYKHQRANYKDWGDGPAGDVLAALDESVKANPLADPNRLFITGGSYAGYLTAWIIGHDNRFKAAV